MKKNWVIQGASFAAVAALLAGCQTGQKADSMSFAEKYPTYGMDVLDQGGANGARGLASIGGPLMDMVKAASSVPVTAGAKSSGPDIVTQILGHVGTTADGKALAARLKKDPSKLTVKDIEGITDVKAQVRIVESFMATRAKNTAFGPGSAFAKQTNDAIQKAKLGLEYHKSTGSGLLTSRGKGALSVDAPKAYEKVATAKAIDLDDVLEPLLGRDEFTSTAAKNVVKETKDLAGRVHQLTGHSYIIKETCDNLDLAALESYNSMLRSILDQMETPVPGNIKLADGSPKKFKHCKNLVDIETVTLANFQVGLAREGRMAWVAVEEMGTCRYIPPATAAEAGRRKIASADVPKTPTCN